MKLESLFPKASPLAIDLLKNMLMYDPTQRYTAEQCLKHPYFAGVQIEIRNCNEEFDWSFDEIMLNK